MEPITRKHYRPWAWSFTLPQVYDESLTFVELLYKLEASLQSLVDQLNDKWSEESTKELNKYFEELFVTNVTYTPEDKGLHLNISDTYASGDHIYDPATKTMRIVKENDNESTFKI